jgi:acyl-CoA synthetase (AMP-forming)/AMP-acid ligase II
MVISELEIRAHCARHLPSYMLPDEIAFVDAMPKGDRGKTDYAALAAQSSGRTPSGR